MNRYNYLMKSFEEIGYKEEIHENLCAFLIMKYGLFPSVPFNFNVKFIQKSILIIFYKFHSISFLPSKRFHTLIAQSLRYSTDYSANLLIAKKKISS
jgi:hypothetical protein